MKTDALIFFGKELHYFENGIFPYDIVFLDIRFTTCCGIIFIILLLGF